MKIDLYKDKRDFLKLREPWEALIDGNQDTTVFQTLEWSLSWWNAFGAGKELNILVLGMEEGLPAGIAPLYITRTDEGERVLRLIGGVDLSDYLDLIYLPGREEEVLTALLDYLNENRDGWDRMELHNVPAGSITTALVHKLAAEKGLHTTVEEEEVCPSIPLPATWEAYLATLGKKDRHELRRKMRKAGSAGGDKRYVVGVDNNLQQEVDEFIQLHRRSRKEKDEFMENGREAFFQDFTRRFQDKGWLDLSFLMIEGQRAAALMSFKYMGTIYIYNSGYDPAFSSYSAGIALMGQSIKTAIEEGYNTFDLLRGREAYKYRLGARDSVVYQINVSPRE